MRKSLAVLCVFTAGALCVVTPGSPATGSPISQTAVVKTNPADFTPRVTNGVAVHKMIQLGSTMYAGGQFTQVQSANRVYTYARSNLFAFNPVSGGLTAFNATFNGAVWALATDGTSLYAGGTFTAVNGIARRGLVKLNPYTGAVDPAFNASLTGSVFEAVVTRGRLIIGGDFTKKLQAVNLLTGKDTGYIKIAIAGQPAANAGPTKVFRFAVNPLATRLVMIGTFTSVGGLPRRHVALVTLGASSAVASTWGAAVWNNQCAYSHPAYARDVDFSPDSKYFVVVSTGAAFPGDRNRMCDSASKWWVSDAPANNPAWVNYTGGDTLLSVTVTTAAVYVQGHQRWLDNPLGNNTAGPGAVSRPGIGAINPATGKALPWNPTKDRGVGGFDLLLTPQGLWVPSDTTRIGGETHERVALLPRL